MKKRVGVFTSTRADFGILRPLIDELIASSAFEVGLFVTGTHLSAAHGQTINEIKDAGFQIDYQVPIFQSEAEVDHNVYIGQSVTAFSKELSKGPAYDLAIILGDRFEALAFGLVCYNRRIPTAHLHGGEVTLGALDDAYRHALTKFSSVHFPCAEDYAQRIIRMGEEPSRVHNVGALAIDNVKNIPTVSRTEIEARLEAKLKDQMFLMTYHPETTSADFGLSKLENLISALGEYKDASILLTGTNKDNGSEQIRARLEKWAQSDKRVVYVESLGTKFYFSAVRISQLVIGNSSSGILEVPFLKVPTLNVGTRQDGRLREKSVVDTAGDSMAEISGALKKALAMNSAGGVKASDIFGSGNTASKIVQVLKGLNFDNLFTKRFYDGN